MGDYSNIPRLHQQIVAAIPALGLDQAACRNVRTVGDTVVSADVGFVIYLRGLKC